MSSTVDVSVHTFNAGRTGPVAEDGKGALIQEGDAMTTSFTNASHCVEGDVRSLWVRSVSRRKLRRVVIDGFAFCVFHAARVVLLDSHVLLCILQC